MLWETKTVAGRNRSAIFFEKGWGMLTLERSEPNVV
jgi:hypothetical protein